MATDGKVIYVVTADDVIGSSIAKYSSDVDWWARASGMPRTSVEVVHEANGNFREVEVAFPSEDAAKNFQNYLASFGVKTVRK